MLTAESAGIEEALPGARILLPFTPKGAHPSLVVRVQSAAESAARKPQGPDQVVVEDVGQDGPRSASADDHHRTGGVLRNPVCGRAEQVVAQEMATVAEDHEIEAAAGGEVRDDLGRVSRAHLD